MLCINKIAAVGQSIDIHNAALFLRCASQFAMVYFSQHKQSLCLHFCFVNY